MSMLDKMRECGFSKDGEAFGQACEKTDVKANTKTSVNQHDKERSKKGAGSGQAGANSTGSKNSFNSKREFFDARGLKLAEEDIEVIKEKTREILADLAPRYYFNSKVEPQVRIQGNAIKISIPVEKMR